MPNRKSSLEAANIAEPRVTCSEEAQRSFAYVVLAGNGREALQALEKGSFDLTFMDVQMPEMDGFQATAAIREKEMGTDTHSPVIALTAHAIKGDRERCLAAGMDGYLTKPIRPRELDDVLESYLARRAEKPAMAGSSKSRDFAE